MLMKIPILGFFHALGAALMQTLLPDVGVASPAGSTGDADVPSAAVDTRLPAPSFASLEVDAPVFA